MEVDSRQLLKLKNKQFDDLVVDWLNENEIPAHVACQFLGELLCHCAANEEYSTETFDNAADGLKIIFRKSQEAFRRFNADKPETGSEFRGSDTSL